MVKIGRPCCCYQYVYTAGSMQRLADRPQQYTMVSTVLLHSRVSCVGLTLILAVFRIGEQGPWSLLCCCDDPQAGGDPGVVIGRRGCTSGLCSNSGKYGDGKGHFQCIGTWCGHPCKSQSTACRRHAVHVYTADCLRDSRPPVATSSLPTYLCTAIRRQPRAPDTVRLHVHGLLASMPHLSSTACRPCISGHAWRVPWNNSLPWTRRTCGRICGQEEIRIPYHAVRITGLSGRTCLNSLIGTDLQEQGSSRPGTCCNKGTAKTATTGSPYPAHVHSTGH